MYYDSGKKKKKTEKSKNAEWINLTTIISYLPFYYPEVKERGVWRTFPDSLTEL